MALTVYGSARSRTMRVLWAAAELGLTYIHEPLAFDDPALKAPEFLHINSAGAVPAIVDDGFALSESLAINLYLAKKYGAAGAAALWPATLEGEADVWRWSLWAQGHLEPWVQRDRLLAHLREALGELTEAMARGAIATLNRALAGRQWLVGETFTIGDLNVAAVLSPSRVQHLDLTAHGDVQAWLARCYARPAAVETRRRFADGP
jgi:glutathione S-transferase